MAWYFNFCAPHLPNDPVINIHRYAQTGVLLVLMLLYMMIHFYYKMYGPTPSNENANSSEKSNGQAEQQSAKNSEQNSENPHDEKSISIAGGFQGEQNSSIGPFQKKMEKSIKQVKIIEDPSLTEPVDIAEVESFFPIVFGHFAIASTFSIMYSPYAEQTLGSALYVLLALLLTFFNARRWIKVTRFIWGVMGLLNCFLLMSALLEVGQSNYNKIQKECFSVNYQSLY